MEFSIPLSLISLPLAIFLNQLHNLQGMCLFIIQIGLTTHLMHYWWDVHNPMLLGHFWCPWSAANITRKHWPLRYAQLELPFQELSSETCMFFAVYVMLGLIPFEYACRHAVDSLVVQAFPKLNREKFSLLRAGGEGFLIYAVSLGVALAVPGQSSNIITATGTILERAVIWNLDDARMHFLSTFLYVAKNDPFEE